MDSNIKLSNVIGAPFQQYVLNQLYKRAEKNSTKTRTLDQVLFIANKTAWARLVSSVDVIGRQVKVDIDGKPENQSVTMTDTYTSLGVDYKIKNDLAKNWVLEAGTSRQVGNGIELKYGVSASNATGFTNTVNSSYGLGGTTELGYVPMPGLTSITVETLGRLGSLRKADINFRVSNLNQLNVIEALYFRLGYSMILEWGHTQYYKNNNDFVVNGTYGIGDPFKDTLRMGQIIQQVNDKTREANGNYGGMPGIVIGFNWNATQDGGYDCTLKLIGRGAIMDSLKVNQSYALPPGDIKEYKKQNQLLEEETARQKERLDKLAEERNASNKKVIEPTVYPAATSLQDLYEKVKLYGKPETYTFIDFVHEFGWPTNSPSSLVGTYDIKQDDKLYPSFQLDRGRDPEDFFIVFQTDWIRDPSIKAAFDRSYTGTYFNQGGVFTGKIAGKESLTATLDLYKLETNIKDFYVKDYVTDGRDYGGEPVVSVAELGNILASKRQLYTAGNNIVGLIWDAGSYDANTISWRNTNLPMALPALSIKTETPFGVESAIYGSVGLYDLTVSYAYTNSSFPTTPDAVALAFRNLGNSTAGKIPVNITGINYGNNNQSARGRGSNQAFKQYNQIVATFTVYVPDIAYIPDPSNNNYNYIKNAYVEAEKINPGNYTIIKDTPGTSFQFVAKQVPVIFTITTNEISAFSNWTKNGVDLTIPPPEDSEAKGEETEEKEVSNFNTGTQSSPEGFSSALQAMLTIVQTYCQTEALYGTGVQAVDIGPITKKFYDNGALAGTIINDKIAGLTGIVEPKLDAVRRGDFDLLSYALKGFNATVMADKDQYENIPTVDYYQMAEAYVFKYKMPGIEGVLGSVRSPTYISLGYLLAFLNNMCLIYDSNQTREFGITNPTGIKLPYIFIDCNPATNFCFTSPQQFSIDPTICMVSMQASKAEYATIYPEGENGTIATNLVPKLFDPTLNNIVNVVTDYFPFKAGDQVNQGSLMNILLNCQYLLDLCVQMSQNDPEHAVNLKPFLDQIMIDVNKSLGGVNSFRVAYLDESNVIQIVDDQWVPSPNGVLTEQASGLDSKQVEAKKAEDIKKSGQLPSEEALGIPSADAPGQVVLIGTKSTTRELRFNTLISSKLASKIAISAQAEVGSVNDKDHSPYSHLNTFYEDRYSRTKEDPSKTAANAVTGDGKKTDRSTDQQAADLFNGHVISVYSDFNAYSPKNIQSAKNYYLGVMSKVKSEDPGTTANPYISLELEMTIDGVSGILMGNAFTVPNDRLPYTFRGLNNTTKIAFIVTGLVHTIQNNEWLTKIKGQMIKLKKAVRVGSAVTQIAKNQTVFNISNILGETRGDCGGKPYSGAKRVPEGESVNSQNFSTVYYPGFKFVKGTSDINLKKGSLEPITVDTEIKDDTTSNRFNIGKNSPTPSTFVIHHTAGNPDAAAVDVYEVYRCSGHPAHYVVTKDGKIHRFLPDGAKGWHAQDHNTDSIGVEVTAKTEDEITEAQKQAVARLAQYLGFKKDQLRYHGQYENRNNNEGTVIYNYIINNL